MTPAEFQAIQALVDPEMDQEHPLHRGARLYFVGQRSIAESAAEVGVATTALRDTLRTYVAALNRRQGHNGVVPLSDAESQFLSAIGLLDPKAPGK